MSLKFLLPNIIVPSILLEIDDYSVVDKYTNDHEPILHETEIGDNSISTDIDSDRDIDSLEDDEIIKNNINKTTHRSNDTYISRYGTKIDTHMNYVFSLLIFSVITEDYPGELSPNSFHTLFYTILKASKESEFNLSDSYHRELLDAHHIKDIEKALDSFTDSKDILDTLLKYTRSGAVFQNIEHFDSFNSKTIELISNTRLLFSVYFSILDTFYNEIGSLIFLQNNSSKIKHFFNTLIELLSISSDPHLSLLSEYLEKKLYLDLPLEFFDGLYLSKISKYFFSSYKNMYHVRKRFLTFISNIDKTLKEEQLEARYGLFACLNSLNSREGYVSPESTGAINDDYPSDVKDHYYENIDGDNSYSDDGVEEESYQRNSESRKSDNPLCYLNYYKGFSLISKFLPFLDEIYNQVSFFDLFYFFRYDNMIEDKTDEEGTNNRSYEDDENKEMKIKKLFEILEIGSSVKFLVKKYSDVIQIFFIEEVELILGEQKGISSRIKEKFFSGIKLLTEKLPLAAIEILLSIILSNNIGNYISKVLHKLMNILKE